MIDFLQYWAAAATQKLANPKEILVTHLSINDFVKYVTSKTELPAATVMTQLISHDPQFIVVRKTMMYLGKEGMKIVARSLLGQSAGDALVNDIQQIAKPALKMSPQRSHAFEVLRYFQNSDVLATFDKPELLRLLVTLCKYSEQVISGRINFQIKEYIDQTIANLKLIEAATDVG